MALVWLYGRRKWSGTRSWRASIHHPAAAIAFIGIIVALGSYEEGLWDPLIWRDHAVLFGGLSAPRPMSDEALMVIVPALVLPQATHYVLDSWIWKFDGSNPGLRYYLFLEGERPTATEA